MKLVDWLILLLMVIALTVFCFNLRGIAPWPLVAAYWAVLTVKNYADFRERRKDGAGKGEGDVSVQAAGAHRLDGTEKRPER